VAGDEAKAPGAAITVTAVGDVMLGTTFPHETQYLSPGDGMDLLIPMIPAIQEGDIRFGNLEGPLVDGGESTKCGKKIGNCYAFRSPTRYARHLKDAGFTVMSLANNHALDFGEEGRSSTEKVLRELGIHSSGKGGSVAEFRVKGLDIAFIAFHTADHSNFLLNLGTAEMMVAHAAKNNDLVLVSFHGGAEGYKADRTPDQVEYLGDEERGNVIQFSHRVIDAGADLVLGHGPHVLRGMELYKGRLIAYSLGNFATYARFNLRDRLGYSVVLKAELDREGRFLGGKLTPAIQLDKGGPQPDAQGRATKEIARLCRLDFPYTGMKVDEKSGAITPPGTQGAGFFAVPTPEMRDKVKQMIRDVKQLGRGKLGDEQLARWFGDPRAGYMPEVPERFKKPAEKKWTFERYRKIFITDDRIAEGREFVKAQDELLSEAAEKYDVHKSALAALIAVETRFGTHKGKFPAFNALASVVLGYPRRAPWAARELAVLCEIYRDRDPLEPLGSYAGAVGYPQFMPSSIKDYGVDADGDGWINLGDWKDAIHSCANYIHRHGWKTGEPIKKGSKTYRALFKYNPSHYYARVVGEMAEIFGYEPRHTLKAPLGKPKGHKAQDKKQQGGESKEKSP